MEGGVSLVSESLDYISGVRILSPSYDPAVQYDIALDQSGSVKHICLHKIHSSMNTEDRIGEHYKVLDATNHLIAPSLCHAHIHLDKCFLLSDPKFSDLEIIEGDFPEAMKLTSEAKTRFEKDDLLRRGRWLIGESLAAGVTHMRAFVEVDHVVEMKCLDAAFELKKLFASACQIQICVFAQEPLFSGQHADANRQLMEIEVGQPGVGAIGSTPYVEDCEEHQRLNIEWTVRKASAYHCHIDFHLDYNLDFKQASLTTYVIDYINDTARFWERADRQTIALGHCTRLTKFSSSEWTRLSESIRKRPFYFIGLPTSDLFIQGKPSPGEGGGERLRGTLQIPQMMQQYGVQGAISINNVGNAFTPYGSCDPLSVASMGVGLYHAGTKQDTHFLYGCISTKGKEAIGYPTEPFAEGASADFVLFNMGGTQGDPLWKRRGRKSLPEVVYDPPKERKTIFKGRQVIV